MRWGIESGGVEWVVVEVRSRWVVGDGRDRCSVNARGRGRISHRLHGVELGCEDFDDVGGVVRVVWD